ncbi:MAG: hypothetical protein QXG91_02685 [Candidatus Aenigmatarchaeota archaeon]
MTVVGEKMSWLIALILITIFIVFIVIFKDVIIEKLKFLIDITWIKKISP